MDEFGMTYVYTVVFYLYFTKYRCPDLNGNKIKYYTYKVYRTSQSSLCAQ